MEMKSVRFTSVFIRPEKRSRGARVTVQVWFPCETLTFYIILLKVT